MRAKFILYAGNDDILYPDDLKFVMRGVSHDFLPLLKETDMAQYFVGDTTVACIKFVWCQLVPRERCQRSEKAGFA